MQAARAHLLYVVPGRVVAGAERMMTVARISAEEVSIPLMVEGDAPT